MNNVKVNGNTYNGIERIRLTSADGGTVDFVEASAYDGILGAGNYEIYDTITTNIVYCAFTKGSFTANFPNAVSVSAQAFMNSAATEIRLPNVETIGATTFSNSSKLSKCVLSDKLSSIPKEVFYGTKSLVTIVLPYNGVVSLTNTGIFTNSAVASGTGYVYVPSAQVEAYKTDANWSTYANQIRAIEDYPNETA